MRYLPENSIVEYGPKKTKDPDEGIGRRRRGDGGGSGGDVGADTPNG